MIFLFALLLAIFGIFFALTINSRSLFVILSLLGTGIVDLDQAQFIIYAIIAPVVEEFAKIYPALIFSVHFTEKEGKRIRYIPKPQIFLFLAVIGGAVFNMLETYWYSWQVGSLGQIEMNSEWIEINFQLILRAVNPLHVTSALISALGIIVAFQVSTRSVFTRSEFWLFIPYFLGSVLLHGLWNGSLFIFPNQEIVYGLPILNIALIPICLIGWFLILMRYRNLSTPVCLICNQWHLEGLSHQNDFQLDAKIVQRIVNGPGEVFLCENCNNPKPSASCQFCSTTQVFACRNCKYPLPIFAETCWKCKSQVRTIFDDLLSGDEQPMDRFFQGLYYFFSLTYVLQLLLSIVQFSLFEDITNLPTNIVLFFIISTALIGGLYLNLSSSFRQWGIIMSRYIVSMIMLLISLLILAVSILFLTLFPISGIFLLLVFLVYFTIFIRVIYPQKIFIEVIA